MDTAATPDDTVVAATAVVDPVATVDDTDAAVAEAACSYNIESTTFVSSVQGLIDRAHAIVKIVSAPRCGPVVTTTGGGDTATAAAATDDTTPPTLEIPTIPWATCTKHLGDAMAGSADPAAKGFTNMFSRFFYKNREALIAPLNFSNGAGVRDEFFRSTERVPAPGGSGLSKHQGPVVYYSDTNPRFSTVCLPIGECYTAALKAYKSVPKSNIKVRLFPTLTLLDFYLAMYHSVNDDAGAQEELIPNICDLCEAAEAQAPGSGPAAAGGAVAGAASESAGFDNTNATPNLSSMIASVLGGSAAGAAGGGLGNMFSTVLSAFQQQGGGGGGGGAAGGPSPVMAALSQVATSISSVVQQVAAEEKKEKKTLASARSADGTLDTAAIVRCIGRALDSDKVQEQIAATQRSVQTVFSPLTTMATQPPPPPPSDDNADKKE